MIGLCFHSNPGGEWDTIAHPEISLHNVRKHFCEESDLLYMITDQASSQGSFKKIKFCG